VNRSLERLKILWVIYRPVRGLFALYLLAVLVGALLEGLTLMAIVPLIGGDQGRISDFFDAFIEMFGLRSTDQNLIFLVGGLVVLRAATRYASTLLSGLMVRREAVQLQVDLFRAYLGVDWETVVALPIGELQLLLGSQTQRAADFLGRLILLIEGAIFVVGLTAAAMFVSPNDTLLAVALIGVTGVVVTLLGTRIRRHAEGALRESKSQSTALLQFARGASVLRAFGVSGHAVHIIEEQARKREALTFRSERAAALAVALPDLLFVLALLVVVGVSFEGGSGIAEVTAVIALLYRISQYVKRFGGLTAVQERLPDLRDVYRSQNLVAARTVGDPDARIDSSMEPGAVLVDNVSHTYASAARPAIAYVDVAVRPGEFIGVVGSSGSGKSTLAHILVGLIDPTSGMVRVGGEPDEERDLIAFVPQVPFVLQASVLENIRWFRPIEESQLLKAAEMAGLKPVLDRLPLGIRTEVAQEGLTISGGERQRLALARALAGSPRVLILDEATSALDSESERAIQATLRALQGSVTIIAVAHRLSTVLSADRIWVMEDGRIIEEGPPAQLLADERSRFARLGSLQGLSVHNG
jgi:ABC-type multidrug transport system fused ATPase/permease subunit